MKTIALAERSKGRAEGKKVMADFNSLPVEITDLILREAARGSRVCMVVIPFVCHLWYERKSFWARLPKDFDMETISKDASAEAAGLGLSELLQWLKKKGCPADERTCAKAAEGGHFAMLKWAKKNGYPWDSTTCEAAAGGGRLGMLKWVGLCGCEWG